jgi:hypothetical protein
MTTEGSSILTRSSGPEKYFGFSRKLEAAPLKGGDELKFKVIWEKFAREGSQGL